jgi:hypothetical protein
MIKNANRAKMQIPAKENKSEAARPGIARTICSSAEKYKKKGQI